MTTKTLALSLMNTYMQVLVYSYVSKIYICSFITLLLHDTAGRYIHSYIVRAAVIMLE